MQGSQGSQLHMKSGLPSDAEGIPFCSGLTICMSCAGQDTFFCTRKYDAEKGKLEEAGDGVSVAPAAQAAASKVRQGLAQATFVG